MLRATCIDLIRTDLNSRRSPWARFLTPLAILADQVNGIDCEKRNPASPYKDLKTSDFKRYLPGALCQNMDPGEERGFQTRRAGELPPLLSFRLCFLFIGKKPPRNSTAGRTKTAGLRSTFFFTVD